MIYCSHINKIINFIDTKFDLYERKEIYRLQKAGKLFFLSELIPFLQDTRIFAFGTGGSITNLKNIHNLKNYNLMSVSLGPFYFYKQYGFIPNIWSLHYGPTAEEILNLEKKIKLDLSDTFILIPANDSRSSYFFSSSIFKKFRLKHPEATYVLYRENRSRMSPDNIHPNYLSKGIEPLRVISGTLEGSFLPFSGFLGIKKIFFSGIDHLHSTGHFWDKNRFYQNMKGNKINFPDEKYVIDSAKATIKICSKIGLECYRMEKKDTILMDYPYIEFEKALKEATPKITPNEIRSKYSFFKYDEN